MSKTVALLALTLFHGAGIDDRQQSSPPDTRFGTGWGVHLRGVEFQAGEIEKLRDSGAKWVTVTIPWDGVEKKRGVFEFGAYDRFFDSLSGAGLRAVVALGAENSLYTAASKSASYLDFFGRTVARFKGRGVVWEIGKPFPGALNEQVALAREVGKAISSAGEMYAGPGVSIGDWEVIQAYLDGGLLDYWSAVAVHPTLGAGPELEEGDWARLRGMIDRSGPQGKSIPMLCSACVFSDSILSRARSVQGEFAVRQHLMNLAAGIPLTIYADWKDALADSQGAGRYGGLVERDLTTKVSYRWMQELARQLNGFKFNKRLETPEGGICLLFQNGDRVKLVAWTTRDESVAGIVPTGKGVFTVATLDGSVTNQQAGDGGVRVRLTGAPVIVEPMKPDPVLLAAARWAPMPPFATIGSVEDAVSVFGDAYMWIWKARMPGLSKVLIEDRDTKGALPETYSALDEEPGEGASSDQAARLAMSDLKRLRDRSVANRILLFTMKGANNAKFAQRSLVAAAAPLSLRVAFEGDSMKVTVSNPAGAKGTFILAASNGRIDPATKSFVRLAETKVEFEAGEKEGVVALPIVRGEVELYLFETMPDGQQARVLAASVTP